MLIFRPPTSAYMRLLIEINLNAIGKYKTVPYKKSKREKNP